MRACCAYPLLTPAVDRRFDRRKTDSLEFNLPVYKCDDGPFRLYYSRVYRRWVVSATMHKPPYHLYAATCVGMQQPRHCPASTSRKCFMIKGDNHGRVH